MKSQYALFGLITLLSGSALALPAPSINQPTVRDVLKRAGTEIRSCTVPGTAALTFDDGPFGWGVSNMSLC